MTVVVVGFGIFYFEDFSKLLNFFKNLVFANNNAFISDTASTVIRENIFLIIVAAVLSMPVLDKIKALIKKAPSLELASGVMVTVFNILLLVVSSIMLVDATNNPFLYFKF
jgi:alginate O-acetyltransferase complex protein AlgI